jgi:hypothetical protein
MNPGFIAGIFLIPDFEDYKWISLIVLTITEICFIYLLNTIMLSAALLLSSSVATRRIGIFYSSSGRIKNTHSSSSGNSIGHWRRVIQNATNPLIRINL